MCFRPSLNLGREKECTHTYMYKKEIEESREMYVVEEDSNQRKRGREA